MKSYSVVLSGEAGQGLKTIETLFMKLLRQSGYYAFMTKELMSRVRGGNNTTELRVSSEPVYAFTDRIDLLIVLGKNGIRRLEKRLSPDTIVTGETDHLTDTGVPCRKIPLPIEKNLEDIGGTLYANTLVSGLLCALFSCNPETAYSLISAQFAKKGADIVKNNNTAFDRGMKLADTIPLHAEIKKDESVEARSKALSGTESIGIGALAGGCNFIASYPMSPGTGVLTFMASHADEYGVVAEQAEDELAALNMELGAWYAGARAMVTTSGGGFALMTEALSLAGCIESPAVIHLAERPGPATGLPTRTEQGDLNLAVYAGHGDFPRVIYAPGTLQDGIELARRAFDTADEFQVPVILLTDQYFLDSEGIISKIDFSGNSIRPHITETSAGYKRYALTKSGVSPRGIPGYGNGIVRVDSDEHTEEGLITEDADVRIAMTDKRMRKLKNLKDIEPELIGSKDYETLVVGWGSTYGAVCEALERLGRKDIAFAHFAQVYPVPKSAKALLAHAKRKILVENNVTGQFGNLLKQETLTDFDARILKYNGMQFSVEELVKKIGEVVGL
ncbi:MAG TPA: 2-oxoacid:acceptor oxidoreductase subunit alpha [Treponema sp.]|nr:2-oxoacid:acceptor oxidoreductase subunit alpha [Treponema sp.]